MQIGDTIHTPRFLTVTIKELDVGFLFLFLFIPVEDKIVTRMFLIMYTRQCMIIT